MMCEDKKAWKLYKREWYNMTVITLPILVGKSILCFSRITRRGNGSTWPGHVALSIDPYFISHILNQSHIDVIFIVGTNGKTTTARMLTSIIKESKQHVFHNVSGANLENGIASTLIRHASTTGKLQKGYAVFEVDENNLPILLEKITPKAIIVLNLFRDQLDRYGELDSIAAKWKASFKKLTKQTTLVLNADDPLIAYLGVDIPTNVTYFGLEKEDEKRKKMQHAADSIYCPRCNEKLKYSNIYFSHLGIWKCLKCNLVRPKTDISNIFYPLPGTYNKYNTLAAALTALTLKIPRQTIIHALKTITPAFGRQEKITYRGKPIQLFLSKNPTSFNESLATIVSLKAKTILFVLNDRIPDGRDISWIWDVDFEEYVTQFQHLIISGNRTYDLGLRLQYTAETQKSKLKSQNSMLEENLEEAIQKSLKVLPKGETLFILPTYSAMLEVRKILTGRKIL